MKKMKTNNTPVMVDNITKQYDPLPSYTSNSKNDGSRSRCEA